MNEFKLSSCCSVKTGSTEKDIASRVLYRNTLLKILCYNMVVSLIKKSGLNKRYVKNHTGFIKLLTKNELRLSVRKKVMFKKHVKIRCPNTPYFRSLVEAFNNAKEKPFVECVEIDNVFYTRLNINTIKGAIRLEN